MTQSTSASSGIERLPLTSAYLCGLDVTVGPIVSLGIGPYGERRVVDILGGRVEGPGMCGVVARGGADWQIVRADGVVDIDAHYSLLLDDGARVEVVSSGMRHGPPEVLGRLGRGDPVDPSEYFFRTVIRFQTGAPRLRHLNRTLAIAIGARRAASVELTLYGIL
jgi:Protein of unknown function (DUF3237)